MLRSLWIRFLLPLVAVAVVGLSATFVLRELMVRDFGKYREGQNVDRAVRLSASIESSYEKNFGWNEEDLADIAVWALMDGIEMRLFDDAGRLVIDTGRALGSLSALARKRVLAVSESRGEARGAFAPHALFYGGVEIGRLEVRFAAPRGEDVYVRRANRFLVVAVAALGAAAIVLSLVFSRLMARPVSELTHAASRIAAGDMKSRVAVRGRDEIGKLAEAFNTMARVLETQEVLRRRLTSNIAHELRTPLSVMRGELEAMMDGLMPPDKGSLQSLYAEVGRLRGIIDGIEELTRAEASLLRLERRQIALCPFLENIVGRYRGAFAEKGVLLGLECSGGLSLQADPDKLSQVVINLLDNALKATGHGGSVTVSVFQSDSSIAIKVADTGAGIMSEDLPFIFERFYRATPGGLGIGLAIVKELVEAHGGRVRAESRYGEGSVFTVTLPA